MASCDKEMFSYRGFNSLGFSENIYPYDGYIEVTIEFAAEVVSVQKPLNTLAIVCLEPPSHDDSCILLGTYSLCWGSCVRLCNTRECASSELQRPKGLTSVRPLTLPPLDEAEIEVCKEFTQAARPHTVLVEPFGKSAMASQVIVTSGIHTVPSQGSSCVTLKKRGYAACKLWELHSVESVPHIYKVTDPPTPFIMTCLTLVTLLYHLHLYILVV